EALADLNAAKEQLKEAAKLPEQHQLKIEQQQAAVDAMKYRLAAATFVRDLKEKLAKNAIDPKEAAAAAEHVKELEAGVRAEEAKLKELKLVDPQSQLRRAEHDVAVREARVKQAKFAVDECVLKAPANGKVLQVLTGPGS